MLDLNEFDNDLGEVIRLAKIDGVQRFLAVCVHPQDIPALEDIANRYPEVWISAGVHPNEQLETEPDVEQLAAMASHEACIAIGETGLDYYRCESEIEKTIQQQRFRNHIQVSRSLKKPLIIHTRQASDDTLKFMREEKAGDIGGVMHCFSEDWAVAQQALDLNFYISFSGIVTFKSAQTLQAVAQKVPLDRILIETDSPYLAPVPFRGKQNHPALVKQVALMLAMLRGVSYEAIAEATTHNFFNCFRVNPS
jgi:TatD DNase family protein